MSWAEMSRINSDLTTPLNELIENSYYLYASDNTLTEVHNQEISSPNSWLTVKTVTARYKGALRLAVATQTKNSTGGSIRLTINDVTRISWTDSGGSSGSPTSHEHKVDFSVNAGDVIKIEGMNRIDLLEGYIQGTIGIGGQALSEQ